MPLRRTTQIQIRTTSIIICTRLLEDFNPLTTPLPKQGTLRRVAEQRLKITIWMSLLILRDHLATSRNFPHAVRRQEVITPIPSEIAVVDADFNKEALECLSRHSLPDSTGSLETCRKKHHLNRVNHPRLAKKTSE